MTQRTMRDDIAIAAMAAFIPENSPIEDEDVMEAVARDAYRLADIMLEARGLPK